MTGRTSWQRVKLAIYNSECFWHFSSELFVLSLNSSSEWLEVGWSACTPCLRKPSVSRVKVEVGCRSMLIDHTLWTQLLLRGSKWTSSSLIVSAKTNYPAKIRTWEFQNLNVATVQVVFVLRFFFEGLIFQAKGSCSSWRFKLLSKFW